MDDKRMTMVIVGCHKDKKLLETPPATEYDLYVQAGAAFTRERIYPFNDMEPMQRDEGAMTEGSLAGGIRGDAFEGISDRNHRYSEMTAVYWAWKNISTPYVGIEHYRRRFTMSPGELSRAMDEGVDIITLENRDLGMPMSERILSFDFAGALYSFLDIAGRLCPEDLDLIKEVLEGRQLHPCNMNIMKLEVFREYCSWIFPILDDFYRLVPLKKDAYLRRDVGFAAERLSSVFIEKMKRSGRRVIESGYRQYKSEDKGEDIVRGYGDTAGMRAALDSAYQAGNLNGCRNILALSLEGADAGRKAVIEKYFRIFNIYELERRYCDVSVFEYLPEECLKGLDDISSALIRLGGAVISLLGNPSEDTESVFVGMVKEMHFSGAAVYHFVRNLSSETDVFVYAASLLSENGMDESAQELLYIHETEDGQAQGKPE